MLTRLFLVGVLMSWFGLGITQNKPIESTIKLQRASGPISIDGYLEEPEWKMADVASGFYLHFPVDTTKATYDTEVRATFDDQNLYFSFVCYDQSADYIMQSLRRDFDWPLNDNISLYFDPFGDYTNGFGFMITPMGVQREGLVENGGDVNIDWDNKWYSAVQQYEDRWVAEIAIPLKSIRYNDDLREWNINFLRNHLRFNQRSTWIPVPLQFRASSMVFTGKLVWPENPPKAGTNLSVIPYVTANNSRDFENSTSPIRGVNAGFDAKIAVTPSLNLDLTVNPDFSQVEVDEQVINLSRFEFRFPERRQFFLENSDLFGQFGFPTSRPFFSRRIGIATDTLGNTEPIPIQFGARLSGKLGSDWRIGLLNMQTGQQESLGLPAQNYGVIALQKKVFDRSNIGFVLVNKQSMGIDESQPETFFNPEIRRTRIVDNDTIREFKPYNRVAGIEYNLFSSDNKWEGDFYYQNSFDEWTEDKNYNHGAFLRYQSRNFSLSYFHEAVGENFTADAGFVPRVGFNRFFLSPRINLFPKNPNIATHEFSISASHITDTGFLITDREYTARYSLNFIGSATFNAEVTRNYELMFFDFNPIRPKGDSVLIVGTDYTWNRARLAFGSDRRDIVNFDIASSYGGFYNGSLFNITGRLNYRYQPYVLLSINFDYNDIRLAEGFGEAKFFLIGPRLDLTFTDKLFLTSFFQYNNRLDNVNINTRLQWRFKPVSDLFLVYTDNYVPNSFEVKNRALVLKLTYWLNI